MKIISKILLSYSAILLVCASQAQTIDPSIKDIYSYYGPQVQSMSKAAQQQLRLQMVAQEAAKKQAANQKAAHEAESAAALPLTVSLPYLRSVTINNIPSQLVYSWSPAPYATMQSGTNRFFDLKQIKGVWQLDPTTIQVQKIEANLLEGGILAPSSCLNGQNYQTFSFIPRMRNNVPYELAIISRSPDQYSDFSLIFNVSLFLGNIKSIIDQTLHQSIDHVYEWYISVSVSGLTQLNNWAITIDSIDILGAPSGCSYASCMKRYTITQNDLLKFQKQNNIPLLTAIEGIIPGENRAQSAGVKNPPCSSSS